MSLAGSIRVGVEAVRDARPEFDAAILAPVDQPRIHSALLDGLIEVFEGGEREIVACSYAGTAGAPALFSRRHFAELSALVTSNDQSIVRGNRRAQARKNGNGANQNNGNR